MSLELKLKKAIIKTMNRDDLKAVVDSLEIRPVDKRDRGSMAKSIGRRQDIDVKDLLDTLTEVQVKNVCELLGEDATGRKNTLQEMLLKKHGEKKAAHRAKKESPVPSDTALEKRGLKKKETAQKNNGATLGFEATLWKAADKLRNNLDAAEYKHVVLGLIFLKYISDAFEEKHAKLKAEKDQGADPEDRDEYKAENIFWVPKMARWSNLQANAKQPEIGKLIDDAMQAIEKDNPSLKGVLPKTYARPMLDKRRLGELIDLIGTIGLGDEDNRSKDILGRVYEYFLFRLSR